MSISPASATRLLMAAVRSGNLGSVTLALEHGAKVNARDRRGRTPLIRAVRAPSPDPRIVRILLRAGADAGAMCLEGLTALDHARRALVTLRGEIESDDTPEADRARIRDRASRALDMPIEELMTERERRMLRRMTASRSSELGEALMRDYIAARREAAMRRFDDTGPLERIIGMLEYRASKNET